MIQRYKIGKESRIIFFHVPKTGGVTIRNTIGNKFAEVETYHVINPRGYIKDHPESEIMSILSGHRFIYGHFDLGFLRYVREPVYKMMLLREPIKRIWSLYRFLKAHDLNTFSGPEDAKKRIWYAQTHSFDEFVVLDAPELAGLSNYQVRFMSGTLDDNRGGKIDACDLERAKENIGRLEYFGITDRMRESVDLMCYQFSLFPVRDVMHLNATPQNDERREITVSERDRISERNAWDIEFYAYARDLFGQRYNDMVQQMLEDRFVADRRNNKGDSPDSVILTMDQPFDGDGWYNRESNEKGVIWRFTGPGSVSTLMFRLARAVDMRCTLHIYHAVSQRALDGLKVMVNGDRIQMGVAGQEDAGIILTGIVPKQVLEAGAGLAKVEFHVEDVARPVDIDPANADARLLGVALSGFSLVPVDS